MPTPIRMGTRRTHGPKFSGGRSADVFVVGAGTTATNGGYNQDGESEGKPVYRQIEDDNYTVVYNADDVGWYVAIGGSGIYFGSGDVAFPWMVVGPWVVSGVSPAGAPPAPTVIQG